MQKFESLQSAPAESAIGSSILSEQATNLLGDRQTSFRTNPAMRQENAVDSLNFIDNVYSSAENVSCRRSDDACSWRPNENSQSEQSRIWKSQREAQRDKPIELDRVAELTPEDVTSEFGNEFKFAPPGWSEFEDLDMEAFIDSLRERPPLPTLPFELQEPRFMNLPYYPAEDDSRFENLPFKPLQDQPGVLMTLEHTIDPRSASGFLAAVDLPKLSFA